MGTQVVDAVRKRTGRGSTGFGHTPGAHLCLPGTIALPYPSVAHCAVVTGAALQMRAIQSDWDWGPPDAVARVYWGRALTPPITRTGTGRGCLGPAP